MDHLGSVRCVITQNGNRKYFDYKPFGDDIYDYICKSKGILNFDIMKFYFIDNEAYTPYRTSIIMKQNKKYFFLNIPK